MLELIPHIVFFTALLMTFAVGGLLTHHFFSFSKNTLVSIGTIVVFGSVSIVLLLALFGLLFL